MSDEKRIEQIAERYRAVKDSPFHKVAVQNDEPYDCMPYYDYHLYHGDNKVAVFDKWSRSGVEEFLVNALPDVEYLLIEVQLLRSKVRELENK